MTIGRRAFLARIGFGAAAVPLAGKKVLEAAAAELGGVSTFPAAVQPAPPRGPYAESIAGQQSNIDTPKATKALLQIPGLRDEYESLMFAANQRVGYLDPDIANKRSFSLAAKLVYQRQRQVAREIETNTLHYTDRPYGRIEQMLRQMFNPLNLLKP